MSAPTLWDFIGPAPDTDLPAQLEAIMLELATERGRHGVTVGEMVHLAEQRGIAVGGAPMDDKVKEQRQTSWLPHVPRALVKAGKLVTTDRVRPSPVKRHHKHRHTVYVLAQYAEAVA